MESTLQLWLTHVSTSRAVSGKPGILDCAGHVGDADQRPALAEARRKLFEAREKRVHPGREEKVLRSWNGLMLAAFAEAAWALDGDDGSRALAASYRLALSATLISCSVS